MKYWLQIVTLGLFMKYEVKELVFMENMRKEGVVFGNSSLKMLITLLMACAGNCGNLRPTRERLIYSLLFSAKEVSPQGLSPYLQSLRGKR